MKNIIKLILSSLFAVVVFAGTSQAADPIKLGILEDETGNFSIAVIPKIHAYE